MRNRDIPVTSGDYDELDGAKSRAVELVQEACDALSPYGDDAEKRDATGSLSSFNIVSQPKSFLTS